MSTQTHRSATQLLRRRRGALGALQVLLLIFSLLAPALPAGVATAAGIAPVQTFYLSMPEDQVRTAFVAIDTGNGTIANTMVSITSIAVTVNNTIIYYDQWEGGYEADIANPVQTSTLIFGDGNTSNGNACTYAATLCSNDVLTAGAVLVLRNDVPSNPRGTSVTFDAHDKVAVTQLVAVTRAMWAAPPGTVLAGAIMVYDTTNYGTDFRLPAGENLASSSSAMFDYAGLYIMAANAGTTVSIDADGNGTTDYTTTLGAGGAYFGSRTINGVMISSNAHITSNLPIQVNLITGDINNSQKYENRWFNIPPLSLLGPSYVTPVSSMSNSNSNVFIYNPSQTSSITVYAQTSSGTTNFTVAAKATYRYVMPTGSGARFYTTNSAPLIAIGTNDSPAVGDSGGNAGSSWDWGYTLVAEDQLAPMLALGWAPGNSNLPLTTENGSPVWVSAAAATTVYVDYDGNPATGPLTDPNGNHYNVSYNVTALQSIRIYDPDDDQTGMRVYTVDGTLLAAAWGEDTSTAGTGTPYLDMGYVVFPLPQMSVSKTGVLDVTFAAPTDKANAGDKISYTIIATNTGTRTLHNVTVVDAKLGTLSCTPALPVASLAAGASVTCTGSYILTQADVDAGVVYNTATGDSNETPPITVQEDVPIPLISVNKTADPTSVPETGGNVTFSFTVYNNSPVETFKIMGLTDSVYGTLAGGTGCQVGTVLAVLSSCSFSITRAITGDGPGSHSNTFTVVGSDSKGNLISASDPETVTITDVVPMIDVMKYVSIDGGATWVDANTAPGPFLQSGTNPQFKFVVTNTGAVALGSLTLSDPNFAAFYQADLTTPCAIPASLAPTASYTCYASSAWAAGQHTNTATTTGSFTDSVGNVETGSDADSANFFGAVPALTLTKSATPGTYDAVGQTITYNYTIKNTGNVNLSGPFSVTDNKAAVTCTQPADGVLSPNEEMTCTAAYTVSQADLDASSVTNKATATNGTVTSNEATATVYAVAHPNLSLKKTATPATYDHVGQIISYSYEVTNIGNVALSAPFAVADDKATDESCAQIPNPLPVGSSITCSASYAITQADLDADSVTNKATASAKFGANPVTSNEAQATVNADKKPALAIDKTATETTYAKAGDVIHYSYLVTNSGNVTLHDPITVSDNKTTATCPALPAGGLAPGASITCSATYTIQQSDLDAGSLTNVASATSGTTTSPTDTVTVLATQSPALSLVKSASPATYNQADQVIAYTYDLKNTGNVTLSGPFTVDDDKATVTCPSVISLAVGDTLTCTASHTVTQAEVDSGSITNVAKGHAFHGTTPVDSNQDTKTVTAVKAPALTIVKAATPTTYDSVGDVIGYSYLVTNAGNVTLYNISVVDDKATVTCPDTSAGLAPLGTITCSASYSITQADLDTGSVTNSAYATDGTTKSAPDSETVNAIQQSGLGLTKSASPATYSKVGDQITYTYVVQNTGNITLAGLFTVNDDKVGAVSCPAGSLAPGATVTCTATYAITQADLDASSITNTATATDGTLTSNEATATVAAVQTPALAIDKIAQETTYVKAGDVIHYSYLVTNAGNVTLSGPFTVNDDKATDESCPATASLAPGASITCTASYTIQQSDLDAGSLTNVASATDGKVTSPTDTVTVPATQSPKLTLKKSANPLTYTTVDQTITYDYLLTNSGNVTLAAPFAVSDDKAAVTCPPAVTSLAPGDTLNCTATYKITQADLDSGSVTNIATATAKFGETTVTSNQDTATVKAVQSPALSLVKTATPSTYDAAGQTISYSYLVTNIGNVTLSGPFTVSDNKAAVTCPADTSLAPGASITCTASYVVTQTDLDNGSVTNTAKAKGSFGGNDVFSDEDSQTVNAIPAPALSLIKSALPAKYDHVGQEIAYSYVLKNIGNVTLAKPFSVTDDKAATVTCPQRDTLAVGAEITCNAIYLITQADLDADSVTNIATGHAQTLGGTPVNSNNASATVTATQTPHLSLTKAAAEASFDAAGVTLHYTLVATNDGNVTLTDVSITDARLGTLTCSPAQPATLVPLATLSCTGTYVTTQADVDAGKVDNIANASGMFGTIPIPADPTSESVPAAQTKGIQITKSSDATSTTRLGDTITFSYLVANTGNTTITSLIVTDPQPGLSAVSCPVNTLAPAATTTCTAKYVVTQMDVDAGQIVNTGTAKGSTPAGPVTANDTLTTPLTQSPHLTLTKAGVLDITVVAPPDRADVGDVINYTLTATNDGNTTLTNVTISDPLLGTLTCTPAQPATLAPTKTLTCSGAYVLTQADINSGNVHNVAVGKSNEFTPPETPNDVPVPKAPALTLTKVGVLDMTVVAPPDRADVGDVIHYTLTATNTGNETLTNVTISDPLLGALTCLPGQPAMLAPSEKLTCTGSYTLTQADINAGNVHNVATGKSDQTPPTDTPNDVPMPQAPALSLVKTATPATYSAVGDVIAYSYLVKNTGNVTLAGPVTVADDKATVTCPAGGLAPGASMTCTASYTIAQADLDSGSVKNTAKALANGTDSTPDDETVTAIQSPALSLVKTATPATYSTVGDVIAYSYLVKNTGNVRLMGPVTVTDDKATVTCPQVNSIGNLDPFLDPGESITCTASYAIAQADLDSGSVKNTAQASANGTDSNTDDETVTAVQSPALSLVKTATPTTYNKVGDVIGYSYLAKNTGNVTLYNITVVDDKASVTCPDTSAGLAPQGTITCSASYTIVAADITAGSVTNKAYATDGTTQSPPDSETVNFVNIPPAISVTKTANPTSVPESGGNANFTFTVTNDASEAATITNLSDSKFGGLAGDDDCKVGIVLAPGAGCSFQATFAIPADSNLLAVHTNTFTAVATDPEGFDVTATADATVTYTDVKPTVTLDKSVDVAFLDEPGGDFTFTLLVTNTSWEEVTITALTDSQSGAAIDFSACADLIGTKLAAGASTSCTYDVTHTEAGSYTNTASVSVEDNVGNPASDTDNQTVTVTDVLPAVDLTKSVTPGTLAEPGGVFHFTLTIKNTSVEAVTITALTDDNALSTGCQALVGTTLAAGASTSCTYDVTHTDAGSYPNTAKVTVKDNENNSASDSDSKTVTVTDVKPTVDLTKTVTPGTRVEPGGVFQFTLTIKNTSVEQVTITALTDTNTLSAQCTALIGTTLVAGASTSCSYDVTHTVAGSYSNTASVTVKDNENNSASDSDTKTVTVVPQAGALLPTQTTCQQYKAGPSAWPPMYSAFTYQAKGNKINSVSPGVIFYYNTITAPSASFSLQVGETNSLAWRPMLIQDLGQAILYTADCSKASGVTVTASGTSPYGVTFTVSGATPGATYYIGIKYSPQNLVGQAVKSPYPTSTYSWSTTINNMTGGAASIRVQYKK
jgi:large repetitive protein